MKRLIIVNLKSCFEWGFTFKALSEVESSIINAKDYPPFVETEGGIFEFQSASIAKNGSHRLYYKHIAPF